LLISCGFVHAQNTGAAPYLDSEHAYQVKIGKAVNEKRWVVTDKDDLNPNTPYVITDATQGNFDWFSIVPATTDGTNEQVTIFFDRTIFSVGNWYLQYFEDEDINGDGTLVCVSAREFEIVISENEFYLIVGDDKSQCNDETGAVHPYANLDDSPAGTDLFQSIVTYTVTMNKDVDYNPNNFSFDADFDLDVSNFSAVVTTTDGGSASFVQTGDTYTVTVIPDNGGSDPFLDEVEVTLTVSFNLSVLVQHVPTLTLSNGQAVVAGTPPATTYDNEDIYPIAPATPGDRTQAVNLYALPATRDIGFGVGESLISAQNPLQNSTHNYTVQMDNIADWNRGISGWHIEANSGGGAIAQGPSTYQLSRKQSATNDTASIVFYFDPDVEDEYTLYFTEQNANGCTTVRAYPLKIQPPFDVDIADANDQCSGASGRVYENLQIETTTIDYVVDLVSAGYDFTWQFDITVTCPDIGTTLTLNNFAISTGTVTVLGANSRGVVVERGADPVATQVVVSVTFQGLYAAEHEIVVSLSNITGNFNEVDADGTNSDEHIIFSMPQVTALAGVD
jgi:hypothetical protein